MNKIVKTICCCALSLATIFTIAGCSKKPSETKPTTDTQTTEKESKKDASINVGTNVEGVEYNIYSIKDGKKEEVDTTKKLPLNTKLLVEAINRSTKNVEITNLLGTNHIVQSKTKETIDVTLTDDLSLTSKESDLAFVNLSNDGHVSFKAYYYDSNNEKKEFTDTFTVEKGTTVYFQGVNDTTYTVYGFIGTNDEYKPHVQLNYKSGHDPKITDLNSEGYEITGNTYTGYSSDVTVAMYAYIDSDDVTLSCRGLKNIVDYDIVGTAKYTSLLNKMKFTVNNPTGKKLVFSCNDDRIIFDDETFEYFAFATETMAIHITDYAEYNLTINKPDDSLVDTYVYSYDNDGIEYEVTGGKYFVDTPIYLRLKNKTNYEVTIVFKDIESESIILNRKINGKESFDLYETMHSSLIFEGDSELTITVTEVETQFCKVTFENKTTYDGVIRLGYYHGMYDYPEAEFDTDIVKGTYMAWVGDNDTGVEFMVYVYNADTDALISSEDVGGYESCANGFPLTSNIKIVLDYKNQG